MSFYDKLLDSLQSEDQEKNDELDGLFGSIFAVIGLIVGGTFGFLENGVGGSLLLGIIASIVFAFIGSVIRGITMFFVFLVLPIGIIGWIIYLTWGVGI